LNAPAVVELKAFVPAKDFALSLAFYQDLGFTVASESDGIAYLHHGDAAFLLQDFHDRGLAENFAMHLLVTDVEAWWRRVLDIRLAERYGVIIEPPADRPWRMRDFAVRDPSGVLWRIAQNLS